MGLRERGLMDHMINIYLTRVNPSRSYDVPRGTQTPFGRRNPNLGFLSTHEHLHVRHECDSLREYSWGHFLSFCVSLTTLLPRDTVENSCKEPGYRKRPKRCFVSTNPVCMPLFMTLRCQLLLHFCCCCCFFWQISIGARKRTFSVPYFSLFTCVAIPFWKPLEFYSLYTVNPNKDQTFFEALICFNFPT